MLCIETKNLHFPVLFNGDTEVRSRYLDDTGLSAPLHRGRHARQRRRRLSQKDIVHMNEDDVRPFYDLPTIKNRLLV